MNQHADSEAPEISLLAARQLKDYDACQPGMLFSEGIELDVVQGYALQKAVTHLRKARGEQLIGYKVGCTSQAIREQLGINHCVHGCLFDSEQYASGAVLFQQNFAKLAIEGELAIELAREPREEDFTGHALPSCICRVFPVIELHNHVMRGHRASAGELIANNAIHAGFVSGAHGRSSNHVSKDVANAAELVIFVDDQVIGRCDGPVLFQTIHSSLKWLWNELSQSGERLRAGQIILTGSIPKLFPVVDECCIRVVSVPFGEVTAHVTHGKAVLPVSPA